jgi:hypothetical protein
MAVGQRKGHHQDTADNKRGGDVYHPNARDNRGVPNQQQYKIN